MALNRIDWTAIGAALDGAGVAHLPNLLGAAACAKLRDSYAQPERFRSRVIMQQHGFGRGEYRYFSEPLPRLVQHLREILYPRLAVIANRWMAVLREPVRFPATLAEFRAQCRAAGQSRPTPLLLRYGPGDYNCLHRDVYGPLTFPLQVVILLSDPKRDFRGGEFVLVEQRPRMQSRAQVVPLRRSDAAIFAVHHRPATGTRGHYRVALRHGVSVVEKGERYALGLIFHDAA